MRDDRRRATRLAFTEEEQLPDVRDDTPQITQVPSRLKNPLTSSRLRLTAEELGEPTLEKATRRVDKAAQQLTKAKARLPKKRAAAIARETDIATGKAKFVLSFEERIKPPSKLTHEALPSPIGEVHRQIGKAEDDNVGVESAHGVEKSVESVYKTAKHSYRTEKLKPYRAAQKAERKLDKANIHLLQKQEQLASNPFSRWQQKRAIQKSYRASRAAGAAGNAARKGTSTVASGVKNAFLKNKKTLVLGGLMFLMVSMIMNGLSACTPLIQTGMQAFVIGTYPAEDADILAAERYYRAMEVELENEMRSYPSYHPGFDEYLYDVDDIWHDPHALIALISARIGDEWVVDDAYGFMDRLFEKQYILTQNVTSETRYREEWVTKRYKKTDPITGESEWVYYDVLEEVPYTYRICNVKLVNFNLSYLPFYVLSREGVGRYAMYISVLGNREDIFRGYPHASVLRDYTDYDIPEELLEDETFRRIIEEAEKYLGYPYVWGGDSPETSFDCSGFVSYVFGNSGVRDVGRLGATSLYGACQKITPAQAKPGDLIFFEGTINRDEGISHVGIYVGNNWMIHCGKPVGYQRIDDPYYVSHFFGYGRLAK